MASEVVALQETQCDVGKIGSLHRLIVAIQVDSLQGKRLAIATTPALSNEVT
jgi:hypothetical protein